MSSKVFFCLQINSDSFIISNTAKNVTIISNLLSNFLIRLAKEMVFLLLKLETINCFCSCNDIVSLTIVKELSLGALSIAVWKIFDISNRLTYFKKSAGFNPF